MSDQSNQTPIEPPRKCPGYGCNSSYLFGEQRLCYACLERDQRDQRDLACAEQLLERLSIAAAKRGGPWTDAAKELLEARVRLMVARERLRFAEELAK